MKDTLGFLAAMTFFLGCGAFCVYAAVLAPSGAIPENSVAIEVRG